MPLTDIQKRVAQAIVNIFETGKALGDYAQVTMVAGDRGQLSYGRSQASLASGSLALLIASYCRTPGAALAAALSPFLPTLTAKDPALNQDMAFRGLLHDAGADPAMQACQDAYFDNNYWEPAVKSARSLSLDLGLSICVVYDSKVQGSWDLIRDRVLAAHPDPAADQTSWVAAYVAARRAWMATNSNALLQRTVYRMDAFNALIGQGAWDLSLPLVVRGVTLTEGLLAGGSGGGGRRLLKLTQPMMRGDDVSAVQVALGIAADGVFGAATAAAVTAFQRSKGLSADGVAGAETLAALGL